MFTFMVLITILGIQQHIPSLVFYLKRVWIRYQVLIHGVKSHKISPIYSLRVFFSNIGNMITKWTTCSMFIVICHPFIGKDTLFLFRGQIKSNLPTPVTNDSLKNFSQMIYLSQINQAMTLKSISDWCRVHSSIDMIDPKTSQG